MSNRTGLWIPILWGLVLALAVAGIAGGCANGSDGRSAGGAHGGSSARQSKAGESGKSAIQDPSSRASASNAPKRYSGGMLGFNTQDPYFLSQSELNGLYAKVQETGVKWVRATLFWDLMEPNPGELHWTQSDLIFKALKARGLNAVVVIRSAPPWDAGSEDTADHNAAPVDGKGYGNICYRIAKRYLNRGVKMAFELGNEENTQFFNLPNPDPAAYTRNMLIPGSEGIRRAAQELGVPAPTILVGGLAPVDPAYTPNSVAPLAFMQGVYDNGGRGYFDSVAYHPYTYVSEPAPDQFAFAELKAIAALMNSHGDKNRKIWATEAGFATGSGTGEISEPDQAAYTAEELDLWFGLPYAGPMLWYELVDNRSHDKENRENTFGLLYSGRPWKAKPAYAVFVSRVKP